MSNKFINALPHTALALMYIAGVMLIGVLLTGCTVNIESYGENATFELSPARNIYPNTSVMNGLSLIPSGSDKSEKEEKPANAKEVSNTDNK